ncbi:hypothetical protein FRC00_006377, partial [Tulasnella sp. 408]
MVGKEYESLPQEEVEGYLSVLKETRDYRVETGRAMMEWKRDELASRAEDIAAEKQARFRSIKFKLVEMGWDEQDFPTDNKKFRDLVFKDQKLTPKKHQAETRAASPSQSERTSRIEKRERRAKREKTIRKFYHRLARETMGPVFQNCRVYSILTRVEEVFALPSIKPLLENDRETATEAQWIEVAPEVRHIAAKWWRDTLKQFVNCLEHGVTARPNEAGEGDEGETNSGTETEEAISGSIEALKTQLSHARSVFCCRESHCRGVWWFPRNVRHGLFYHNHPSIGKILQHIRPLHSEGQHLVQRLLTDLKLDPETATSSDVFVEDQNPRRYLCTRCDERVAKYMSFGELVEHYLKVKKWFDDVTEAVQTSPDDCYPSRTVGSQFPNIVNDHDWSSNHAVLVRKEDSETKDAVLKLQMDFQMAGLLDPVCNTKETGGEDWKPAVLRRCLLCPRG